MEHYLVNKMAFISRDTIEKILYVAAGVLLFVAINRFILSKYLSSSNWIFFMIGAMVILVYTKPLAGLFDRFTHKFVNLHRVEQLFTSVAAVTFFISFNDYVIDVYLMDLAGWILLVVAIVLFLFSKTIARKLLRE